MYVPPSPSLALLMINVPSLTWLLDGRGLLFSLLHVIEYREDVFDVQENLAVPPTGMYRDFGETSTITALSCCPEKNFGVELVYHKISELVASLQINQYSAKYFYLSKSNCNELLQFTLF